MSSFQDSIASNSAAHVPDFQLNSNTATSKYLQLMLTVVNQHPEGIGRGPKEPLQLKDLDNLTPDLFRRLMIYLLTMVIPTTGLDSPKGKMAELTQMNDLNVFNTKVYYEASPDLLYWNLRRIFAHNDDMFDYQLLCFPGNEPKRVKRVLVYITAFVLFAEQTMERFYLIQDELQNEFIQKQELTTQIEETKAKINARIVILEDQRAEIPSLQEKMKENNDRILQEEREIAALEEEINKYRGAYEIEEKKNIELETEIESVKAQVAQKKQLIVTDGDEILKIHQTETALLAAASKEREELDIQLEKLTQTDSELGSLIDSATAFATELEEFINHLQSTVNMADEKNTMEADLRFREQKEKESDKELIKMKQHVGKMSQTYKQEMEKKQAELQQRRVSIQELASQLNNSRLTHETNLEKLDKYEQDCHMIEKEIQKYTNAIQEDHDFVHRLGPEKIRKMIREVEEAVQLFNNNGIDAVRKIFERLSARFL